MRVRLYADDGALLLETDLAADCVRGRKIGIADKVVLVLDDPLVERRKMREPLFLHGVLERAP
jgi:hypothetical protein